MTPRLSRFVRRDPERGSLSVYAAIIGLAMVLAAGLAYDGTRRMDAQSQADAIAAEAARAGAEAINARGPEVVLDRAAAIHAAQAYLTNAGATGQVTIIGPRTVEVTATITSQYAIIGLVVDDTFTRTGHAQATAAFGGTPEGPP